MGVLDVRPVATHSDGDGSKAGVGICIFRRGCKPRAAFTAVHRSARRLWAAQSRLDSRWNDIFQIEAVEPLLVAETWPEDLSGLLFLHIHRQIMQHRLLWSEGPAVYFPATRLLDKLGQQQRDYVRDIGWTALADPLDGVSRGRRAGP